MDFAKKAFVAGSLLAVGSVAMAEPVIPAGFENNTGAALTSSYNDVWANSFYGTGLGSSLTFYLYDALGDTTFSLNYNTGLNYADIVPSEMDDANFTLQWTIPTTQALAYPSRENLVWGVSAGLAGSIEENGTMQYSSTVHSSNTFVMQNAALEAAANNSTYNLANGNNQVAGALDITTTAMSANDILLTHFNGLNWTQSANDPSATLAFYNYSQTGTNMDDPPTEFNPTTVAQYAGVWSFDIASGILKYTVGAGSEVPLPAAVWLLLSGLGGMGLVSRRRSAAAIA